VAQILREIRGPPNKLLARGPQQGLGMATIFALVLLPAIFCVGIMALTVGAGANLASYFALACFGMLTGGMFLGLYRLTRRWEDEPI
jgi:hypothetical protein